MTLRLDTSALAKLYVLERGKCSTLCVTLLIMKVSISARIDNNLIRFLEEYQQQRGGKNRSEALEDAIRALREKALEQEYALALDEWEQSGEHQAWDATAADGVDRDATW